MIAAICLVNLIALFIVCFRPRHRSQCCDCDNLRTRVLDLELLNIRRGREYDYDDGASQHFMDGSSCG